MSERKLTDADVMTGFNPAYGVSAEELEAKADAPADEGAGSDGEGAPAPGESGAPTVPAEVDVKLDGRTFKAPKEIADAFTREINRRDGTRGAELQTLRERLAAVEARTTRPTETPSDNTPPEPPVPNPELQIEDPAKYQEQVLNRIRWEQQQTVQGLTKQYEEAEAARQRDTQRREAWAQHVNAFYAIPENAVLRDNKDIVDKVMELNAEYLAPLSVEEGFKELGRLAKERLAKVTGQAPEVKARTTPKPPALEGSTRRDSAVRPAGPKETGPLSLSAALKERRNRAAAAFGTGAPRQAQR